jgi:inhibitor of cysteine peptidase
MSKVYDRNTTLIKAETGEPFSIELESNPTTGFQWEASFDSSKIKLKDKEVVPSGASFGAAGKEIFTFEPVAQGSSTIRLNYKRSWENNVAESVEIKVDA